MADGGIDMERFETKVDVRNATEADIPLIIALQRKCFPGMRPWKEEHLKAHQERFPEGQFVVEVDGQLVGSSSSLIVDLDDYGETHTFKEVTGDATLSTHDPDGLDLYGIEVMVDPDHQGMRIGERLYEARQELAEQMNLRRIIIAGRMPLYQDHPELKPKEYVQRVLRREVADPVLSFQLGNGFVPKRVMPGYLPKDEASLGHALLMEWNNIEYHARGKRHSKSADPVRVCVIQYKMRKIDDFGQFAKQTQFFVDVAANYGSDFAVFPELLTTQLLSCIEEKTPARAIRALTGYTDRYIEHFADLALRYNINILGGTHIVEEDGRLHNVAFLFHRDGSIDRQYKLHVTQNERRWWGIQPGREMKVFDTDVGKVAIHICYDVEFPEVARVVVDHGARILFVPFCTEDRQGYLRVRYCAQARAVENQVYVVMAGTVGNLPEVENMDIQYAQSALFTPSDFPFPPDGIAAQTTPNVETVIVGDFDLEVLRRHRRSGTVVQLQDRRHDLYELKEVVAETAPPETRQ